MEGIKFLTKGVVIIMEKTISEYLREQFGIVSSLKNFEQTPHFLLSYDEEGTTSEQSFLFRHSNSSKENKE